MAGRAGVAPSHSGVRLAGTMTTGSSGKPIDLWDTDGSVWEERWRPRSTGFDREPFNVWWDRNKADFPGLHAQVVEQWVHRHWTHSSYTFLPVAALVSRLETWPTARILKEVGSDLGDNLDADFDYEALRHSRTAEVMNATGTWDYPIVLLHSRAGFIVRTGVSKHQYWLIEGHLRFRYLNALRSRGEGAAEHRVFVLERPS